MSTAQRTRPELWQAIVDKLTAGTKGGKSGQWSARKAQLAVLEYKRRGGGYVGPKRRDNDLVRWTREDWRTASGRPSLVSGERYLPAAVLEALTEEELRATTRAKRAGLQRGEQFTPQPRAIADKAAWIRKHLE